MRYKGEISLLLVAVIWGSGFIASALGLDYLSPYEVLAGRFFVAALLLNLIYVRKIPSMGRSVLFRGGILGVLLYGAFLLQTTGLELTTPSKNAFLTAVNVVVVPFLGLLYYRRKLRLQELLGGVLALTGVGILSLNLSGDLLNWGDVLSFLCAIVFAFHIFYTGIYTREEKAVELMMVQMTTAFLLAFFFMAFRGESLLGKETGGYLAMLYLGLFSTTLAFFVQTAAQRYTESSRAAVIMSMEALFAMVFAVLILGEVLTTRKVLGAAVIFMAVLLPMIRRKTEEDFIPEMVEAAEGGFLEGSAATERTSSTHSNGEIR